MPNIGPTEIIIVIIIALVVFGPKRLPDMGRQIGKALREFRTATSDIRRETGLDEITDTVQGIKSDLSLGVVAGGTAGDAGVAPADDASVQGESSGESPAAPADTPAAPEAPAPPESFAASSEGVTPSESGAAPPEETPPNAAPDGDAGVEAYGRLAASKVHAPRPVDPPTPLDEASARPTAG
jgi:sec-independent protein translocase protein TatA